MEDRNMDQGLLSATTILVLSAKSATRFPKSGLKMQLFAQQVRSGGKSGQRRHKSPGCPPRSEETQALLSSLEAVLGRAAGREGLLGPGTHTGAPLNVLPSGIYSAETPSLPQLAPQGVDVERIQQSFNALYTKHTGELGVKSDSPRCL